MGMKLDAKYHGLELPGKFKIGVSGCPNQCAETCIKDIGLVGTSKGWRLLVGGNGGAKARLSRELVRDLSDEQALELTERIVEYYKNNAKPHQRLGAMLGKMDFEQFKSAILGD
jgi:NAD(P)H-nitrite reductase large subunit